MNNNLTESFSLKHEANSTCKLTSDILSPKNTQVVSEIKSPTQFDEKIDTINKEDNAISSILPLELLSNTQIVETGIYKDLLDIKKIPDFPETIFIEEKKIRDRSESLTTQFANILNLSFLDDISSTLTKEKNNEDITQVDRFFITDLSSQNIIRDDEIICQDEAPILQHKLSLSSSNLQSYIPFKDIFNVISVLDWDNSLFPTMGYTQMIHTTGGAHVDEKFQTVVKKILETAISLGKVFIITNAQKQWIDICVNDYMPCLKPLMKNIEVISACDENNVEFPDNPIMWKKNTFINHINELTFNSKNIICLNDEKLEQTIFKDIMKSNDVLQNINLKLINITKTNSIIELYKQLELILNCYEYISKYDGFIDFDVGIKNI
jgi:hypothetical protein